MSLTRNTSKSWRGNWKARAQLRVKAEKLCSDLSLELEEGREWLEEASGATPVQVEMKLKCAEQVQRSLKMKHSAITKALSKPAHRFFQDFILSCVISH